MAPYLRHQIDYYAVLESEVSADGEQIDAAFRRLAWKYHPDLNHSPGATLQFQDINEAHQVLSNPERRARYDAEWHSGARSRHRAAARAVVEPRRAPYRHRHRVRAAVMFTCAVLFVFSAWVMVFAAMYTAHHPVAETSGLEAAARSSGWASEECGYSMELFPVNIPDGRGGVVSALGFRANNCLGGSAPIVPIFGPDREPEHSARTRTAPVRGQAR